MKMACIQVYSKYSSGGTPHVTCWIILCHCCLLLTFLSNISFRNIIRMQTYLIQIIPDILLSLICAIGNKKLRKKSKFYCQYYDLISQSHVGLKSLLRKGLSEPEFYADLLYLLKISVSINNFSAQFSK